MTIKSAGDTLTIEQLTGQTGTSTRNIRAYQSLGMLAGPRVVGRRGHYDQTHVDRLLLIRKLQQRGYKLAAIRTLLESWQAGSGEAAVEELQAAVAAPMIADAARRMTRAEVDAVIGMMTQDPALLKRAIALDLITPEGNEWLVRSPQLLATARELHDLGLSPTAILDELETLHEDGERIAARMRQIFQTVIFEPFARDGFPAERLPAITSAVTRLRAVSVRAITAVFNLAIERGRVTSAAEIDEDEPRPAVTKKGAAPKREARSAQSHGAAR